MVLVVVLGTIFAASFISGAESREAKVLLKVTDNKTYELVEDVLEELSKIERPIRVFAAVGNARVGKSTMLNLVTHVWDGCNKDQEDFVDEIFKTGDSFKPVTRNVWAHTIHPRSESGSIVLLDVEGFDLGDDTVTKHLSMFTAIISSCLNLFVDNYLGNKDINFLYEISRLSDLVLPNKSDLRNFPKLHLVIRSILKSPDEIGSYVRDTLFKPDQKHEVTQGMVDIIERYFPRNSIVVSQIPIVNKPKMLRDLAKLRESSHWDSFEELINKLVTKCPQKKFNTGGSPIDGQALVKLAEEVVRSMNNENSWKDFGDVFLNLEKEICKRSYDKYIKPVLQLDSKSIRFMMIRARDKFKKECLLTSEIDSTTRELDEIFEEKRQKEEAEERRREKEEERRKKEEGEKKWFTYENLKVAGGVLVGLLGRHLLTLLSDENLKSNVTVLPSSPYNDIGLTGVCWKWNDIAQQKFGLTGEACGVIAQEVQKLYPMAVLVGEDGFLQVRYGILHEIISNHVRIQSC